MRLSSNWRIFLGAIAVGIALVVGAFGWLRFGSVPAARPVPVHPLAADIRISEQVRPTSMSWLSANGYATVIDMRPDGEASDEPSSTEMRAAAQASGLRFAYVPVPHGDIPESAVKALKQALTESRGPVLLYCRSGRRAARTWSLVEASRPDGLDADAILASVQAAGQSAVDLKAEIERRIALRAAGAAK